MNRMCTFSMGIGGGPKQLFADLTTAKINNWSVVTETELLSLPLVLPHILPLYTNVMHCCQRQRFPSKHYSHRADSACIFILYNITASCDMAWDWKGHFTLHDQLAGFLGRDEAVHQGEFRGVRSGSWTFSKRAYMRKYHGSSCARASSSVNIFSR